MKYKNLHSKILFPVSFVLVIIIIIASITLYYSFDKLFYKTLQNELQTRTEGFSRNIENQINAIQRKLLWEAKRESYKSLLTYHQEKNTAYKNSLQKTNSILNLYKNSVNYIDIVSLISTQGDIIASSQTDLVGQTNIKEKDCFQQTLQTRMPYASNRTFAGETKEPVIILTQPIIQEKQIIGLLTLTINLVNFSKITITTLGLGKTGYPYIIDQQGNFIAHPDKKLLEQANLSQFIFLAELPDTRSGFFQYNYYGVDKIARFVRNNNLHWTIIVTIRKDEYKSIQSTIQGYILVFMLVTLLIIGGFIYFRLDALIRAIQSLSKDASKITQGNRYLIIESEYSKELSQLALSFQHLITSLQEHISAIEYAHEEGKKQAEQTLSGVIAEVKEKHEESQKYAKALEKSIQTIKETRTQIIEMEKQASLGRLVSGVAHEMNTPLGTSINYISYLQDEHKKLMQDYNTKNFKRSQFENFAQTLEEALNSTAKNLQKTGKLVASFKQVAADQENEEVREINLYEYLSMCLKGLHKQYKSTHHQLTLHGEQDIIIYSYPYAIMQVVTSLVTDSLLHAFPHKTDGKMSFSIEEHGMHIEILYKDNGKGMDKETLQCIFDPFYTTNRASGNVGLGMHITYNTITQNLKGKIHCESSPNNGVLFTITLPKNISEL